MRRLQFSYGIEPLLLEPLPTEWAAFAREWIRSEGLPGRLALLIEGPCTGRPQANHRMEILELGDSA